jgi:hypothetical protein
MNIDALTGIIYPRAPSMGLRWVLVYEDGLAY